MKTLQRGLPITVAASTTLVDIGTARAALGIDAQSVTELCEAGRLRYAFDLAACAQHRREIRIWAECLIQYQTGQELESDDEAAIESIVGHSAAQWIACSQVAQRFCVFRKTVYRWAEAQMIHANRSGHTYHVFRPSLIQFLHNRRIK